MNIIAEVKEFVIEFTERKGHYPKHIILGRAEKARLRNLPDLLLLNHPEQWPGKLFCIPLSYTAEESCIRVK